MSCPTSTWCPIGLGHPPLERLDAAQALSAYLAGDTSPEIVADWPEDIAQFCMLLLTTSGDMVELAPTTFTLLRLPGFSTAANSKVPHNALHDARALRDHVSCWSASLESPLNLLAGSYSRLS